jgi:hypothetical protein
MEAAYFPKLHGVTSQKIFARTSYLTQDKFHQKFYPRLKLNSNVTGMYGAHRVKAYREVVPLCPSWRLSSI